MRTAIFEKRPFMNNKIQTSIIMITYNKFDRLKLSLESINRLQNIDHLEMVIVNDGSTDKTGELLYSFSQRAKLPIHVITSNNGGRSAARNIGIENSKGSLLIFIDDDMLLSPHFVFHHVQAHRQYQNLVVHGQIKDFPYLKLLPDPSSGVLLDGRPLPPFLKDTLLVSSMLQDDSIDLYIKKYSKTAKFERDIQRLYAATKEEDVQFRWIGFTGGNVSVRKKDICAAGLFDTSMGKFWGCEDLEMGYRLAQHNVRFAYVDTAINYHMSHFRKNYAHEHKQALSYFYQKHKSNRIKLLSDYFEYPESTLEDWMIWNLKKE